MVVRRGRRRYLLDGTGVVTVTGGQAGRFVFQILDEVPGLDRVVNGCV